MKNIWFFGDSYTRNWGCQFGDDYFQQYYTPTSKTWTELVEQHFDGRQKNTAQNGAGNDAILAKLRDNFFDVQPEDIVIIYKSSYYHRVAAFNQGLTTYDITKNSNSTKCEKATAAYYFDCLDEYEYYIDHIAKQYNFFVDLFKKQDNRVILWDTEFYTSHYTSIEKIANVHSLKGHWTYKGHSQFFELFKKHYLEN